MTQLHPATTKFIDTITNPIDCVFPGLVPDGNPSIKLNLRDRYDAINSFKIPISATATPVSSNSFVIWLSIGADEFFTNSSYADNAITHRVAFAAVNNDIMVHGSDNLIPVWVNDLQDTLFDYVKAWRYLGAGFRIKSIITNPTVTSSYFITSIRLIQVTSKDLYECWSNAGSVANLFNNAPLCAQYGTGTGATTRHLMVENDYLNALGKFGDNDKWQSTSDDQGNVLIPAMFVIFNNSIGATEIEAGSYEYTYPCQGNATFHLEGILDQPTPLYGVKSPSDVNLRQCLQTLGAAQHAGTVPWHATYHSFKKFTRILNLFAKHAVAAARVSSRLSAAYTKYKPYIRTGRKIYRAVKMETRRGYSNKKDKNIQLSKRISRKAKRIRKQNNKKHRKTNK